jgi:(S)-ureidoglycine aminohydrolase
MKNFLFSLLFLQSTALLAQTDTILAKVYSLKDSITRETNVGTRTFVFRGSTKHLEFLSIHYSTLQAGKASNAGHANEKNEELIIVREGNVTITVKNKSKTISAGGVALIMPSDWQQVKNNDTSTASYYVMQYRSRMPKDTFRADTAGGSLLLDWKELVFKPHEKGGVRPYFNRATAMCKRFEMHTTSLNEGLKSHDPHNHFAEEIILLLNGKVDMLIGDKHYKGSSGDLFFLSSNIPHNLTNEGKGQAMYVAFQFN